VIALPIFLGFVLIQSKMCVLKKYQTADSRFEDGKAIHASKTCLSPRRCGVEIYGNDHSLGHCRHAGGATDRREAGLAWPQLNFDLPWLTDARLHPLHTNAVIFAFGGSGLFATSYHIKSRCQDCPQGSTYTFFQGRQ